MTHTLAVLPEAKRDLRKAVDWYEAEKAGLGFQFMQAVDSTIDSIVSNPLIYAVVYAQARLARVHPYPYQICFQYEGTRIVIFAITHTARDPAIWQNRVS